MRRAVLAAIALLAAAPSLAAETYPTPDAALKALYESYTTDPAPDAEIPESEDFFSARLKGLYAAANARADGVGALDFDPVIAGQDWSLSKVAIGTARIDGPTAHATVRFQNFDAPQTLDYTLVRENGGWLVDDIRSRTQGEGWTLSELLKGE